MTRYLIYTDTAEDSQAGFSAGTHEMLQLIGDANMSRLLELANPTRDDFEPGDTNDFSRTIQDVGNLKEVYVRVDGSRDRAWHLRQVRVCKVRNGQVVQAWSAYNVQNPSEGIWFDNQHGWEHKLGVSTVSREAAAPEAAAAPPETAPPETAAAPEAAPEAAAPEAAAPEAAAPEAAPPETAAPEAAAPEAAPPETAAPEAAAPEAAPPETAAPEAAAPEAAAPEERKETSTPGV